MWSTHKDSNQSRSTEVRTRVIIVQHIGDSPELHPAGDTTPSPSLCPSSGHKLVTSGKRFNAAVGRLGSPGRLPACPLSPLGCLGPAPRKIEDSPRRCNLGGLPLQIRRYSCSTRRWLKACDRHSWRRILMRDYFLGGTATHGMTRSARVRK